MNDIYSLETPESVAVSYPIAGIGSRFLALLIDSLIQTLVIIAVVIVMYVAGLNLGGSAGYVVFGVGTLIIAVILLGYFIFFEIVWNGQTPGKRAMRLRVILTSGYPLTPLAALIRNVLRLVDVLPTFYAVGIVTMIVNKHARRVGDLVAGTMVIKEGREGTLAALSSTAPPVALPSSWGSGLGSPYGAYGALPPSLSGAELHRLTREDEVLLRDFLSRRAMLSAQRRYELATQIAGVIHARLGGAPPQAPEAYLEQVLAAHMRQ
jgi:uncharacterized RDD family membrane protein YckC